MQYYTVQQMDQPSESWVLFEAVEQGAKRNRPRQVPSTVYGLLGKPPARHMKLKSEYERLQCKTCGRYDAYASFDVGYHEPVQIRIEGDYSHTDDRVFVISSKLLQALKTAAVRGYETTPIAKTGWHAFRATVLVDCDESVITSEGRRCVDCNRPEGAFGIFKRQSELSLPTQPNTFFTTAGSWPHPFYDRELFCTEDVVQTLKSNGIKGDSCVRLWTDQEARTYEEEKSKGKDGWRPKGSVVYL